jgi:hypothetical protein
LQKAWNVKFVRVRVQLRSSRANADDFGAFARKGNELLDDPPGSATRPAESAGSHRRKIPNALSFSARKHALQMLIAAFLTLERPL